MLTFGKTFTVALLLGISTYIHKSTCYKQNASSDSCNTSGITDHAESDLSEEQKYASIKNKIIMLLEEDDDNFGKRLSALVNDDEFREHFSNFIHKDASEKLVSGSTQEKEFQNDFDSCNSSGNHKGNTDPFKFYNSLEDFFHELKRENNSRTKPANVNGVKRNKSDVLESDDEDEDDIAIKIPQNLSRNQPLQSLFYDYEYKRKHQLWLEKIINKLDSKFALEMTRFLKLSSRRTRVYKGKGLSGYLKSLFSKYRVFTPLATGVGLSFLTIYIAASMTNPAMLALLTLFAALLCKITLGMGIYYILRTIHLKYYS
ncbi:unnamed protein product [Plasmodium vivax]|uniref:(malaria parasite P. vivax) hypothetical protein n=1 Tax=Plasmodium vivax TaxID=5855 RepID=A0A8S4H3D9_PLAVI|nr:unnamed protein product [Plasmodium vivax]